MQFGTAFVPDGRDLCWIGTKDRRYWSNGLGCIPAISKLRAAGEFFARQILSVLDILGVAFANLDLRTLRVRPTLVGRLGGSRNRVRMPVIEWNNRGQPQTRARRKSRVNLVRRFEFFQPIAVLAAARYCRVATRHWLLSPKAREPRNTPNTRKHDITVGGFISVCSACSVVKKGIATQAQDHLPDRNGLLHQVTDLDLW